MRALRRSFAALAAVLTLGGCSRDGTTGPGAFPDDPKVFIDGFADGVTWQAFEGSLLTAMSIDNAVKYRGKSSLKIVVPNVGDPNGAYAGGAFVADIGRVLTKYDAITFWAKASVTASLDVAGLGNDNTGTSQYPAERTALALTTSWQKYTIAIPLASKLTDEKGLFFFAEGPENGQGYTLWLDDIQFETLGTVTNPRPAIAGGTYEQEVGDARTISGTSVTFAVGGVDQPVTAAPGYFTFASSNSSVATVANGVIAVAAAGTATITASLGNTAAVGSIVLNASAPPASAAPTPTRLAADVISLFSNAYTSRTVDTWSASWDEADVADVSIAGNAAKKYTNMSYAGIEFTTTPIDATAMTGIHLDLWVTQASGFKIKLVDFGANGAFGGGDDTEHEVTLNTTSTPAIATGAWNSVDIPFSAFTGLTSRGTLAQLIISGSPTAYLDNVYFYKIPPPPGPTAAAATPTNPSASVISLFSNAYTDRTGTTWSTSWDQADVADVTVGTDDVKKYTNLVFAGIEPAAPIDASAMTTFNFDLWLPDSLTSTSTFKVKLVDWGADGAFGGGDDTEHELAYTPTSTPALVRGEWVRFRIPLSSFTGMTSRSKVAQLILSGTIATLFIDNIFFSADGPSVAAPTPTYAAGDVISLFSNAYTNRTVDTWSASWDQADVSDVQIGGNDVKKYTNLVFSGIEFTSATVNATAMTHFSFAVWTPDPVVTASEFKVKLVDFGANNAFGGGDDKEHELVFNTTSTPAFASGSWVTFDIPLTQFTGLTTRANLAQLIFVSAPSARTVFIDNVLFHK
ncbi:MAG: lipoprotein [Gemmatimonadaceae bacterium]|jgi:predicted small lipoprotein YifL